MAGEKVDVKNTLKEALYENLGSLLSPDATARKTAESDLKVLEVTDEFGVQLSEFTVDTRYPVEIRQLSSVLLKQYVENHWDSIAENKFRPPETTPQAKVAIRNILPMGLGDDNSKIRISVAYALSAIARYDWPDSYPELFPLLMQRLSSGDANAVHGAMRVLAEFSRELTDVQIPSVAPVLLPELYNIITQEQLYSARTRSRALDIINSCVFLIGSMVELQGDPAKALVQPIIPKLVQALAHILARQDAQNTDCRLKQEALKLCTSLVKSFPKMVQDHMQNILPAVWKTMTDSAEIYLKTSVNNMEEKEDIVDSDGDVLSFEKLVYEVFEFVQTLTETSKFRSTIKKSLTDLIQYIILYLQVTEEQVHIWEENPDRFVEDEDYDTFSYSVRISAHDLLSTLGNEFTKETCPAVISIVQQYIESSGRERQKGWIHWWKSYEAALCSLGAINNTVIDEVQAGKLSFDVNGFIRTMVLPVLNENVNSLLLGRCLWFASRYTPVLEQDLMQKFLQATVSALSFNQPMTLKISAVRATCIFGFKIQAENLTELIRPFLSSLLEAHINLLETRHSEVLALAIEAVSYLVKVDKHFTAGLEPKLTPILMQIFLQKNGDPIVIDMIEDVIKRLCENEAVAESLQARLVPSLLNVIAGCDQICQASGDVPIGLAASSLSILETLLRHSPQPLSPSFVGAILPPLLQYTRVSDDCTGLQNTVFCLTAVISRATQQLVEWKDGDGNTGISYILQCINKFLDHRISEAVAEATGRLVLQLIGRLGTQLGPSLDLLLRAVLSRLQTVATLTGAEGLILVYASLMNTQMKAVLDFLTSVPDPQGKPALHLVMTEWCAKQHMFFGAYQQKVSSVALCRLLEHAVSTNDQRLQDFEVIGDEVNEDGQGVRTRSRAKKEPNNFTKVPLLVKVYKLIINELANELEKKSSLPNDADDDSGESDDEANDDSFEVVNASNVNGDIIDLNEYLEDDDEDGYFYDPDAKEDPVYEINLYNYLQEFLQHFAQHPAHSAFLQHTNERERRVLQQAGISV